MRLPSAPLSLLALSFALPLLACGGDPGPGGDLGGSWRELPYASDDTPDPIDQRTVWTFNDDGTVRQYNAAVRVQQRGGVVHTIKEISRALSRGQKAYKGLPSRASVAE